MDVYGIILIAYLSLFTVLWMVLCYVGGKLDQKTTQQVINSDNSKIQNTPTQIRPSQTKYLPRRRSFQRIQDQNQKTDSIQEYIGKDNDNKNKEQFQSIYLTERVTPTQENKNHNEQTHQFSENSQNQIFLSNDKDQQHHRNKDLSHKQQFYSQRKSQNDLSNQQSTKNDYMVLVLKPQQDEKELSLQIQQASDTNRASDFIQGRKISASSHNNLNSNSSMNINLNQRYENKQRLSLFKFDMSQKKLQDQQDDHSDHQIINQGPAILVENNGRGRSLQELSINSLSNIPVIENLYSIQVNEPPTPGSPLVQLEQNDQSKVQRQYNCDQIGNINLVVKILKKFNPNVQRSFKFTQLYIRFLEVQLYACLILRYELNQSYSCYCIWGFSILLIIFKRLIDAKIVKLLKKSNSTQYIELSPLKIFIIFFRLMEMLTPLGSIVWQLSQWIQLQEWLSMVFPATLFDLIIYDMLIFIFYGVLQIDKFNDTANKQDPQILPVQQSI